MRARRGRVRNRSGDVLALRDPTRPAARPVKRANAPRRPAPAGRRHTSRRMTAGMTSDDAARSLPPALDNLAAHKLRTALTMLGMIFGVGAVIAMLSIGAGRREAGARARSSGSGCATSSCARRPFKPDELQECARSRSASRCATPRRSARRCPASSCVAAARRNQAVQDPSPPGEDEGAACLGVAPRYRELAHRRARRGALLRRAGRERARAGLRDRRRGAARPLRLRPGARQA